MATRSTLREECTASLRHPVPANPKHHFYVLFTSVLPLFSPLLSTVRQRQRPRAERNGDTHHPLHLLDHCSAHKSLWAAPCISRRRRFLHSVYPETGDRMWLCLALAENKEAESKRSHGQQRVTADPPLPPDPTTIYTSAQRQASVRDRTQKNEWSPNGRSEIDQTYQDCIPYEPPAYSSGVYYWLAVIAVHRSIAVNKLRRRTEKRRGQAMTSRKTTKRRFDLAKLISFELGYFDFSNEPPLRDRLVARRHSKERCK